MQILTFIPARGGSKSIKNKNLILLGKKKLIDFTLDIAFKLGKNFFTFVSTDSQKILKHCLNKNMRIEYKRPKFLSGDSSNIVDSIFHALKWLNKKKNYKPDAILLLQPTSPFRDIKKIKKAINEFKKNKYDSMVGIIPVINHPYECVQIQKKGWTYLSKPQKNKIRRQDYEKNFYFIDGGFYLIKTDFLFKYKSLVVENKSFLFKFSDKYSIDIDDYSDLKVAKSLLIK